MEKDNFHVDMSGRIYDGKNIGIAIVGTKTKVNYGCALKGNLIKLIKRELFKKNIFEDSAKLYAICIYLLVKEVKDKIDTLIICNDEDFEVVKKVLLQLLNSYDFDIKKSLRTGLLDAQDATKSNKHLDIINISEFRKRLGRNLGSFADNYAKIYRKRALKPKRWIKGKKLNIIEVTYRLIKQYWEGLK